MHVYERKVKNESGAFVKAKSKALKMYGDLKKSKATQPISLAERHEIYIKKSFNQTRLSKAHVTGGEKIRAGKGRYVKRGLTCKRSEE
ncbi:hypothetical protein AgCh_018483 [Apium graveolens]